MLKLTSPTIKRKCLISDGYKKKIPPTRRDFPKLVTYGFEAGVSQPPLKIFHVMVEKEGGCYKYHLTPKSIFFQVASGAMNRLTR